MKIAVNRAWRYPQTRWLLIATGLGVLTFLGIVGLDFRAGAIALIVAGGMVGAWLLQFPAAQETQAKTLLQPEVMAAYLQAIATEVLPPSTSQPWQQAQAWAAACQEAAAQIAQQDSLLIPDLLETLYTVEALARQVAGSAAALEQVQTEQYRILTQEHLETSCDRLQATHDQLQHLRDQLVLAQLTTEAAADTSLPDRLQLLIDANKTTLNTNLRNHA